MKCEVVRVKSWGKGPEEFVEINATDYDPAKHELYSPEPLTSPEPAAPKVRGKKGGE
jgi:hypothetical protein